MQKDAPMITLCLSIKSLGYLPFCTNSTAGVLFYRSNPQNWPFADKIKATTGGPWS